jgi:pimeloyl-ACP methyl ester carboxylesterase
MGWSDPSKNPRTAKVMTEELHQLLQNGRVAGPYVLLGHSFGGMIVRMFAALYRDEASAVVLVDSVSLGQDHRLPLQLQKFNAEFLRKQTLKDDTMVFGLPRLMGWCGNGQAEIRSVLRMVDCRVGPWKEHLAEYSARPQSSDQVSKAGSLGNVPVS